MAGISHTLPTHRLADIELPERYALVRHIADGGMASVWCAQDRVLSRKVAIKVLAPRFRADKRAVRCFEREARAAARLSSHRNIVTILDVGETSAPDAAAPGGARASGPPFIVMEHLAGGTVADARHHENVSLEWARRWIHEAAAALDYAHGQGVVHGDVKPGNMLLDGERVLHIADFGIARIAHEDTISGTGRLFGTAAYISPEQALGERATAASDRYALALVAFELLSGERPFAANGFAALARCHAEQEPPAVSSRRTTLTPTLDPVLRRGMAKHADERWPTAAALANAIDAALSQRRVMFTPTRAPAPRQRTRAPAPRQRTLAPAPRQRTRAPAPGQRNGAPAPRQQARRSRRTGGSLSTSGAARRGDRRRARAVAVLAAVIAVLAAGALAVSQTGSNTHRHLVAASRPAHTSLPRTPATVHATRQPAARQPATRQPAARQPATRQPAARQSAQTTAAPRPATSAASLEADGHSLILAGQYGAAIPVLEQALHAAAPGSLLYQWALFDLGHSYRAMGDLQAAIPLLQERLRYPDGRPTVESELRTALREYRPPVAPSPPARPGQGRGGH